MASAKKSFDIISNLSTYILRHTTEKLCGLDVDVFVKPPLPFSHFPSHFAHGSRRIGLKLCCVIA